MCIGCAPGLASLLRPSLDRRRFVAAGGAFTAAAVGRPARAAPMGPADLIFHNGPILTANDARPRAEAVAIRRGRIVAVGRRDAVLTARGPGTRMIDLGGHTLAPGLIDPHMHTYSVMLDDWIDAGPAHNPDIDAALARVRAAAARTPHGQWVRAQGIDPSIMRGAVPTLDDLDALSPDNPLFILESNGHVAYANRAAFAAAGLGRDTPDPPQGRFLRDASGGFTGRVEEPPAFAPFMSRLPRTSAQDYSARISRLADHAAVVGCTLINDMAISTPGDLQAIRSAADRNSPVRFTGFLSSANYPKWREMGLTPGWGDDRFRLMGVKAWSDGSNQARTGYQREPYLNSAGRGALNYSPEELARVVATAHADGWQLAVHANGDAAIDVTLDAYEAALTAAPRRDHRARIEHCSILHPDQIARMAKLGVSPSFLIGHVHFWGRAFRDRILGPARADLYDPCRSALAAGLRITLHSDYSVTPLEPLRCMENAVTRVMRDGGDVLNPAEKITPLQALKAMTLDAAWQCRVDHLTGSLEPGKAADLVILEQDPTAVDPHAIAAIKVVETWLGGRRRRQA